jgi:transcriptional regulator
VTRWYSPVDKRAGNAVYALTFDPSALSEKQKEVLRLYVDGWTQDEIAEKFRREGKRPGTQRGVGIVIEQVKKKAFKVGGRG